MSSPDEKPSDQPPEEMSAPAPDPGASRSPDAESRVDIAKRFLQEASVKDSPREKKVEFLRSKDLTDDEIDSLLGPDTPHEDTPSTEVGLPCPPIVHTLY